MGGHAEDSIYALLTDGATVEIRPARPEDFAAVRDMHVKMSPDNLYLRFFSMSPHVAEQEARRICREPGPDHAALLALLDSAKKLVAGFLAEPSRGGWLPLDPTVELLGCYGVPLAHSIAVTTEDAAIAAAERFGGPVATARARITASSAVLLAA